MIKNSTLDKLKTIALSNVIKNLPLEKEKIIGVETSYKLSDLIKSYNLKIKHKEVLDD